MMKGILTERNIVVVLFVMVMITFSLAQKETKKMEQLYYGVVSQIHSSLTAKLNVDTHSSEALPPAN